MAETVLVVDDEDSVRRTMADWLRGSGLGVTVFDATDAESALAIADEHTIDLAVLDWNLGAGSDGLQLLQDLYQFQPDICAILVTGYAHQATPLDALRMGVRDYLDKNQNLTRDTFVAAVRRQLERIAPAKREREINRQVLAFRESLDEVLPVVRAAAALSEGVPFNAAVRGLFRFVIRMTGASDGVLVVRQAGPEGTEWIQARGADGHELPAEFAPFARSIAASVLSMGEPLAIENPDELEGVLLHSFERGRRNLLAGPVSVAGQLGVVVELFDKRGDAGFSDEDRRLLATAAEFGAELLGQILSERQTHRMLLDAVAAAMAATEQLSQGIAGPGTESGAGNALERLKEELARNTETPEEAEATFRLAGAINELTATHGPVALRHCAEIVRTVRRLLDEATGLTES